MSESDLNTIGSSFQQYLPPELYDQFFQLVSQFSNVLSAAEFSASKCQDLQDELKMKNSEIKDLKRHIQQLQSQQYQGFMAPVHSHRPQVEIIPQPDITPITKDPVEEYIEEPPSIPEVLPVVLEQPSLGIQGKFADSFHSLLRYHMTILLLEPSSHEYIHSFTHIPRDDLSWIMYNSHLLTPELIADTITNLSWDNILPMMYMQQMAYNNDDTYNNNNGQHHHLMWIPLHSINIWPILKSLAYIINMYSIMIFTRTNTHYNISINQMTNRTSSSPTMIRLDYLYNTLYIAYIENNDSIVPSTHINPFIYMILSSYWTMSQQSIRWYTYLSTLLSSQPHNSNTLSSDTPHESPQTPISASHTYSTQLALSSTHTIVHILLYVYTTTISIYNPHDLALPLLLDSTLQNPQQQSGLPISSSLAHEYFSSCQSNGTDSSNTHSDIPSSSQLCSGIYSLHTTIVRYNAIIQLYPLLSTLHFSLQHHIPYIINEIPHCTTLLSNSSTTTNNNNNNNHNTSDDNNNITIKKSNNNYIDHITHIIHTSLQQSSSNTNTNDDNNIFLIPIHILLQQPIIITLVQHIIDIFMSDKSSSSLQAFPCDPYLCDRLILPIRQRVTLLCLAYTRHLTLHHISGTNITRGGPQQRPYLPTPIDLVAQIGPLSPITVTMTCLHSLIASSSPQAAYMLLKHSILPDLINIQNDIAHSLSTPHQIHIISSQYHSFYTTTIFCLGIILSLTRGMYALNDYSSPRIQSSSLPTPNIHVPTKESPIIYPISDSNIYVLLQTLQLVIDQSLLFWGTLYATSLAPHLIHYTTLSQQIDATTTATAPKMTTTTTTHIISPLSLQPSLYLIYQHLCIISRIINMFISHTPDIIYQTAMRHSTKMFTTKMDTLLSTMTSTNNAQLSCTKIAENKKQYASCIPSHLSDYDAWRVTQDTLSQSLPSLLAYSSSQRSAFSVALTHVDSVLSTDPLFVHFHQLLFRPTAPELLVQGYIDTISSTLPSIIGNEEHSYLVSQWENEQNQSPKHPHIVTPPTLELISFYHTNTDSTNTNQSIKTSLSVLSSLLNQDVDSYNDKMAYATKTRRKLAHVDGDHNHNDDDDDNNNNNEEVDPTITKKVQSKPRKARSTPNNTKSQIGDDIPDSIDNDQPKKRKLSTKIQPPSTETTVVLKRVRPRAATTTTNNTTAPTTTTGTTQSQPN